MEAVAAWQNRPLAEVAPIICRDALVVKVRDKAAHLVIGVDCDGEREVLGIWVRNGGGAEFWAGVCAELGNRGVILACCWGHLPPGAAGEREGWRGCPRRSRPPTTPGHQGQTGRTGNAATENVDNLALAA